MTDYLLHPDLVVDLLREEDDARRTTLADAARDADHGLWLSVAAMPQMLASLAAAGLSAAAARARLRNFARTCTWLGAPAGDGALLERDDLLGEQLASGLRRLGPGARLASLDGAGEQEIGLDALIDALRADGPVPFIDLARQQRRIRHRVEDGLLGVLAHGRYIGGPEIDELESRLARFAGVSHAIALSNGTDALLVAMMAAGVGPGDEVITSPFTFAATGEMILLLGARPVYVDIDPVTYNLDPAGLRAALSPRTRAILPVSIFGQCADFEAINALAREAGVTVIEDGAQSFGATSHERRSCGLSAIGCTSFFPSKPLGGYGDSGACFSDDDALAARMRQVRDHGQDGRYHHVRLGINGRMSSFQASVLLAKLDIFDEEIALRVAVAQRYDRLIAEHGRGLPDEALVAPRIAPGQVSVYAQYSVLVGHRDRVQQQLSARGVPSAVHYPVPLYRQPAMAEPSVSLPVCEDVSARVLSLPMHPYLRPEQQERVVQALVEAVAAAAA